MSTKIIEIQTSSFTKTDSTNSCTINIKIETLLYASGKYYFDITYSYKYSGNHTQSKLLMPITNRDDIEGVIIIKNDMTTNMVKFLLMNNEDLEKVTGNSTAEHYKSCIMLSLALMWD